MITSQIARFMGPPWCPFGADRTQVSPMLAPWTLLSGLFRDKQIIRSQTRKISFVRHISFRCPVVLKFCIEYGNITAVLGAKFLNDWATNDRVMSKRDFTRFGFKMSFGRISYIAHHRWGSGSLFERQLVDKNYQGFVSQRLFMFLYQRYLYCQRPEWRHNKISTWNNWSIKSRYRLYSQSM